MWECKIGKIHKPDGPNRVNREVGSESTVLLSRAVNWDTFVWREHLRI